MDQEQRAAARLAREQRTREMDQRQEMQRAAARARSLPQRLRPASPPEDSTAPAPESVPSPVIAEEVVPEATE